VLLRVQTPREFYLLDILSARNRDVLVRGGSWLKKWTPAKLQRTAENRPLDDASAISIGKPLVLCWHDQTIVTGPVVSVEVQN
jgi:hypothetical protein